MPANFSIPAISDNAKGWGPPGAYAFPGSLTSNFESFDKYPWQKVGRICDFTASGQRWAEQRAAKGKGKGKGFGPRQVGSDEEGFELVDSRPIFGKSRGRGNVTKGKGKGKSIAVNYQEGILGQKQKPFFQMDNKGKGKGAKGKVKGKGSFQQRRGLPSFKDWSVQTKPEWSLVQEIMLSALAKLQIDAREVAFEDLLWCGMLHQYDKIHDRVTPKMERGLQRFEELNFFNVSTTDDPLLPQYLQEDPSINVIATDHVLASLIAAARSIYSWDIVITKISGKLIFDKRDGSHIDFLTVDETAQEPPNNDDVNSMNAPVKLGQEASCLNQNFSQMVLDYNADPEVMENPNPFEEDEEDREDGLGSAASVAYRYRKITIPGNPKDEHEFNRMPVSIAVRTEVNCKMGDDHYVSVKAVNEYDQKKGQSWRKYLDSQRGAVLATVLKDNAFKLGRWTAQAILSGCDIMKLGYVSRKEDMDPWSHVCLTVQTHHTDGFAEQIGMTHNNVFGILRSVIDLVMSLDDGKFVLLKDPTKSVMRLFEVPWDTFGDEEGEDEDEEEEEEEDVGDEGK